MYDEAIEELDKARELWDTPLTLGLSGHAYALAGQKNEARQLLAELHERAKTKYVDGDTFALIHIGLDDKNQALTWLEKAYEERASALRWINVWPAYDPVRDDPRFDDLLRRIGFEPNAQRTTP